MNGAQARLMLDGAEAWLSHVPMPIKDLTAAEKAYHTLRNLINAHYDEVFETHFEEYEHPEQWQAYKNKEGEQ